jgi:hypothetical protein
MPITAFAIRRAWTSAASDAVPAECAFERKTAGIILYVEPLPTPLSTNRATKPTKNSGSDFCADASNTTPAHKAIARKFQNVVRDPPTRSASQPPSGRISDPTSGPRKVR